MNKSKLVSQSAVANYSGAPESETGSKNGYSLKNLSSRRNISLWVGAASIAAVMAFSGCGGGSVGAKAGKEVCQCVKGLDKDAGLEALGCLMAIGEKYKDHFDGNDFKNPQDQKDFIAALKKCSPEFAKELE